jgi:hypothetical protein
MGIVYQAFDRERKSLVALKALRNIDEHSLYRFKNEFRALADLSHPNLVRLGELFCQDGQWFFTMDLVEGVGFLEWVRHGQRLLQSLPSDADTFVTPSTMPRATRSRFDERRLRHGLLQLAQGIAALHESGKVHRDIKPSNILVAREGRVVLLDFGLVMDAARGGQTSEGHIVGTAVYMAPEQATGVGVGPAADWYAVGVVLYEALAGRPPFEGPSIDVLMEKQNGDPAPLTAGPPDLVKLCMELLSRTPSKRPRAADILERLGGTPSPAVSGAMAQTPFVGREKELAELHAAFDHSARGQAVTLLVHGESGVGKSALVRNFVDEIARSPGTVVLQGRCYEREAVPFKAFDGLIDLLSRHLSQMDPVDAALLLPEDTALLAGVFPVLRRAQVVARVPPPRQAIPNPQELRTRAFGALRRLLGRLANHSRLMLFIDDFQWADADSLGVLVDVMHPPDAPPLFLCATMRDVPDAVMAAVSGLGDVRNLPLLPLSPDESRTLAEILAGPKAVIDAATLAREAGGHPLFIQELVRHLGQPDLPGEVKLEDALWARIKRLDSSARRLLEVVVLAGGAPLPQHIALLAASAESSYVAELRAANLVRTTGLRDTDNIEPYHDRVRAAVLAHVDDELRRTLHRRLADALESAGAGARDPQVLVRHLEAAGETGRAAVLAERAARMSQEALAFEQAAALYRTALRLGKFGTTERCTILMSLGDALAHAGRGVEAADAYLEAVPAASSAVRLECQRRAAEQLLISGHIERGLEAIGAVLADVGERLPRTPRRALASLLWQRLRLRLRGLRYRVHDESEIPARELVKLDIYKAVALGLGMVDTIRAADFQGRCLRLALHVGERRRIGRSIAQEAMLIGSEGTKSMTQARALVGEAKTLAQSSGEPYLLAWASAAAGLVHYFGGEFEEAAGVLSDAELRFRDQTTGTAWELSNVRIFRLFALRHLGRCAELGRSYDLYVRDAARRGDRYAETTMTRALNLVWLARDDADQAKAELARRAWSPPEGGYHIQHWYELRAGVEIDLYLGNLDGIAERIRPGFAALDRSLIKRAQMVRAESAWVLARVALARRDPDAAAKPLKRLGREGATFALAWAELVRAGIAVCTGKREAALAPLDRALVLANQAHMRLIAETVRRRRAQLTGEESALADADSALAALGVKNPERMAALIAPGFD